jgi:hypothetical protein
MQPRSALNQRQSDTGKRRFYRSLTSINPRFGVTEGAEGRSRIAIKNIELRSICAAFPLVRFKIAGGAKNGRRGRKRSSACLREANQIWQELASGGDTKLMSSVMCILLTVPQKR